MNTPVSTYGPRRILIFSFAYYPRLVGGAEVAVKEITDRIDPHETIFDMVTIGDGKGISEEKIGNVNVHRTSKNIHFFAKLLFPFAAYFKAKRLHRENHYDAAWSIMANRAGFAALFFKWSNPKVPFILTASGRRSAGISKAARGNRISIIQIHLQKSRPHHRYLRLSWQTGQRRWALRLRSQIVPNGIDYEKFSKLADRSRATEEDPQRSRFYRC